MHQLSSLLLVAPNWTSCSCMYFESPLGTLHCVVLLLRMLGLLLDLVLLNHRSLFFPLSRHIIIYHYVVSLLCTITLFDHRVPLSCIIIEYDNRVPSSFIIIIHRYRVSLAYIIIMYASYSKDDLPHIVKMVGFIF